MNRINRLQQYYTQLSWLKQLLYNYLYNNIRYHSNKTKENVKIVSKCHTCKPRRKG